MEYYDLAESEKITFSDDGNDCRKWLEKNCMKIIVGG